MTSESSLSRRGWSFETDGDQLGSAYFFCGIFTYRDVFRENEGHHTITRLKERSVERGSARRSSLKGREMAIANQTNIGTVSRATLGRLLGDGVERIIMRFSERIDTILN